MKNVEFMRDEEISQTLISIKFLSTLAHLSNFKNLKLPQFVIRIMFRKANKEINFIATSKV